MLAAFGLGDECSNFSVVDGRAKAAASSFSPSIAPSLAPVPAPLGWCQQQKNQAAGPPPLPAVSLMESAFIRDAIRPEALYTHAGAFISMISCSIIVLFYRLRRKWRRHPNPVLYWKSVVDLVFALRFQYDWVQYINPLECHILGSLTQFCTFASEGWFVSMTFDLYQCATDPFTNMKQNLQWYHSFSWGVGFLSMLGLWLSDVDFDLEEHRSCYVDESNPSLLFAYYVFVVISVCCAVVFSIRETQSHPFGGMQEALKVKKDVIRSARIFTIAYTIYQTILISLWITDIALLEHQPVLLQYVRNATSFLQTSKGFIDLVIWFSINGMPFIDCSAWYEALEAGDQYSDIDIDLQPQLNVALRKEVLHFTTRGVVAASSNARKAGDGRRVVRLRLHELDMVVRFNDYSPSAFRDIRRGFGIRETLYRKSFLATCHERIQSGGSSGAFMFYTADYSYLVKSVTRGERAVLLRMLPEYIKYMKSNPGSHLTRFYGCHSIEMYGQDFSFVVMGNAIGRVSMHQFYDIKGSWIDRNAQPIPPGKTVICAYCSNPFKYGSHEYCEYSIHGNHLAHIVLKDNDFHRRLRVTPETAEAIVNQLDKDSDFLCAQGVMDYSLLLSVHSTKYVVDHIDDDTFVNVPSKRKVNYASCHRDIDVSFISKQSASELDLDPTEGSSDEEIENGRQAFRRGCRFSVLHLNEEGNKSSDTSLVSPSTPLRSDSLNFGSYDTWSPSVGRSEWVGERALEKPGYQVCVVVGPDYYTIGVIDMLQTWTWKKRFERWWKIFILRSDGCGISAAPPKFYAERFQRKMRDIMMVSSSHIGFGHH